MKRIVILVLFLIIIGCNSGMKDPFIISNQDRTSEVKIEFTHYDEHKNLYRGKATITNLLKDKVIKVPGFGIKYKNQEYGLYIDSIATILFVKVYPGKTEEIKVITNEIPKGSDFNDLDLELNSIQVE